VHFNFLLTPPSVRSFRWGMSSRLALVTALQQTFTILFSLSLFPPLVTGFVLCVFISDMSTRTKREARSERCRTAQQ